MKKFKVNKTNLVGPNSALPKDPKFYLLLRLKKVILSKKQDISENLIKTLDKPSTPVPKELAFLNIVDSRLFPI